jgi:hypothetical protein
MNILINIFRWFVGVIFCLGSIGLLFSGDLGEGIYLLVLGLLLLPPVTKALFKKRNKKIVVSKPLSSRNLPTIEKKAPEIGVVGIAKEQRGNFRMDVISTEPHDNSIIDVTGQSYKISQTPQKASLDENKGGVPSWRHQYVYSYSEINSATPEQIRFYKRFKDSFSNGICFDLEGNTNYAFILLFDLLNNDYEKHKDLAKLEKDLDALGRHYPKTKSYGNSFLVQKMEAAGDLQGVERLQSTQYGHHGSYQGNYDPDYWKLGNKYKKSLKLNDEEVTLLNRIWHPGTNFCGIEFCFVQVLRLYMTTVKELEKVCIGEGTSLENEFNAVSDVIARKYFKYRKNSNNYNTCLESTTNELYTIVLKYCENCVREHYGHKRKISTDTTYHGIPEVAAATDEKIGARIKAIIPELLNTIIPPNQATEILLNAHNTSRWKTRFDEITAGFNGGDGKQFTESIIQLGELNRKNPSVENIYFEASKFISKIDREAALTLYVHYLYHDLQSVTFNNKQLTKTITKSLFKTEEQLKDFELIVSDLIKDKDLSKAVQAVSGLYVPKRKKIQLDTSTIQQVQQQHSGTVELLNVYLQDEEEPLNPESREIPDNAGEGEISFERLMPQVSVANDFFVDGLLLNDAQRDLLLLFSKNAFSIPQQEVETFSKANGLMCNQLINSINEDCFDQLDDVLIEEDGENFTIYENHFQQILKK